MSSSTLKSSPRNVGAVTGCFLVAGLIVIAYMHAWTVRAGVVFLWFAWLSLVLAGYFIYAAASRALGEISDDGFDNRADRKTELESEKRTLLKAIKETEFDHAMGKTSKKDSEEIIAFYRARAIAILRELDRLGDGEAPSPLDAIESELKARLAIAGVQASSRVRAEKKKEDAAS